MGFFNLIYLFLVSLICFSSSFLYAQQLYTGTITTDCQNPDNSTSDLGYTCNGLSRNCQAYLIFRSQPPYRSVHSIADLLAANSSQISQINSVSENATFETNKLVIVPVTCSCSGQYYQANTSYVIEKGDNYLLIANNTFQGLSTCQALGDQNSDLLSNFLHAGTTMKVPLRCACPTKNQSDEGVKYLLSYVITWGDFVDSISTRFGVDTSMTLEANGLSFQESTIYPFTTLLVPLQKPPSSSQTLTSPPPPSPAPDSNPPPSNKKSKKTWIFVVIGVLGGTALALVIGFILFCAVFRKSKRKADPIIDSESFEACKKTMDESLEFLEKISSIAQTLKVYSYEELQSATDDFSPDCWIRGSVYLGMFNGDFAAIKKIDGDVSMEINVLSKINHFNVIRLAGICLNYGHWYLVYEYAANGPLNDWIFANKSDQMFLNWTQRVQIALDVAAGLNYLHSFTTPAYVHKDVTSSNVLLDGDFRAKIGNFRLARSAEGQEGQFALTRHIVGTKGYMAPEYLENGLVSTKLDVYAFGVLMLEIFSGKEVFSFCRENLQLSNVLNDILRGQDGIEKLREFIDPSLQGNYPSELAVFLVTLIDSCLKKNPGDRMTMDELVQNLSRLLSTSLTWELSNNVSSN